MQTIEDRLHESNARLRAAENELRLLRLEKKKATIPCDHCDNDVDLIDERAERRVERKATRDELHLGRSLHAPRLKYTRKGSTDRERTFAKHWHKHQNYLRTLLRPCPRQGESKNWTPWQWAEFDRPVFVTKREAEVAATVIQWLGTNVGFCWLETVLKSCGYSLVKDTQ